MKTDETVNLEWNLLGLGVPEDRCADLARKINDLIDQALNTQKESYLVSWDTAKKGDMWVVQFWKRHGDGKITLLTQLDKDSDDGGSFTLESLSSTENTEEK